MKLIKFPFDWNGKENVKKRGKEGKVLPDGRVIHHDNKLAFLIHLCIFARGLSVAITLWNKKNEY